MLTHSCLSFTSSCLRPLSLSSQLPLTFSYPLPLPSFFVSLSTLPSFSLSSLPSSLLLPSSFPSPPFFPRSFSPSPPSSSHSPLLQPRCGLPIHTYFSALKVKWLMENSEAVQGAIKEGRCLFGTVDTWIIWVNVVCVCVGEGGEG